MVAPAKSQQGQRAGGNRSLEMALIRMDESGVVTSYCRVFLVALETVASTQMQASAIIHRAPNHRKRVAPGAGADQIFFLDAHRTRTLAFCIPMFVLGICFTGGGFREKTLGRILRSLRSGFQCPGGSARPSRTGWCGDPVGS